MGGCITSSLTKCSGQEVVWYRENLKEKECVVKDIRNKSSHASISSKKEDDTNNRRI